MSAISPCKRIVEFVPRTISADRTYREPYTLTSEADAVSWYAWNADQSESASQLEPLFVANQVQHRMWQDEFSFLMRASLELEVAVHGASTVG